MASDDEFAAWKERAESDGRETLSDWIRSNLNRAAEADQQRAE